MAKHYLTIFNDHDGAWIFGVFDTFDQAAQRLHVDSGLDPHDRDLREIAAAYIEEWDGAEKLATYGRDKDGIWGNIP